MLLHRGYKDIEFYKHPTCVGSFVIDPTIMAKSIENVDDIIDDDSRLEAKVEEMVGVYPS